MNIRRHHPGFRGGVALLAGALAMPAALAELGPPNCLRLATPTERAPDGAGATWTEIGAVAAVVGRLTTFSVAAAQFFRDGYVGIVQTTPQSILELGPKDVSRAD